MKTKIITATTLALVAASNLQTSMAGDREWATAGKVLTGIAAASIISRALEPRPTVVYAPAPTTVVYQTVPTTTTAVVTSQPVYTTTCGGCAPTGTYYSGHGGYVGHGGYGGYAGHGGYYRAAPYRWAVRHARQVHRYAHR